MGTPILHIPTDSRAVMTPLSYALRMLEPQVINDGIMGGHSTSRVLRTPTGLLFEGVVSLADGGGFASFRAPWRPPADARFIHITVKGDDRRYRLVLRTESSDGAAQYQAPLMAPPAWTALRFEMPDFVARFRGRPVLAPPLLLGQIQAFGVLIGEGQSGPFRLEMEWPHAY